MPPRQHGVCVTPHRRQRLATSLSSAAGDSEVNGSILFLIRSKRRDCLDESRVFLAVAGVDLERITVSIALEMLSARLAIADSSAWQVFGVWFKNWVISFDWASLLSVWASCRICSGQRGLLPPSVVRTIWILAAVLLSSDSLAIGGKKKLLDGAREFPEGIIVVEFIPEAGFTGITITGKIHSVPTKVFHTLITRRQLITLG